MKRSPLRSKSKTIRKFCKRCQKNREIRFFATPRAHNCTLCVDQKKREKKKTSLPVMRKKAQTAINRFIRERDMDLGCISCDGPVQNAGHYIAQGSCSYLRYDLHNIHGQCVACNKYKSGNLVEYRIALIEKIGIDEVERLESLRNEGYKWKQEELEEMIDTYSTH